MNVAAGEAFIEATASRHFILRTSAGRPSALGKAELLFQMLTVGVNPQAFEGTYNPQRYCLFFLLFLLLLPTFHNHLQNRSLVIN